MTSHALSSTGGASSEATAAAHPLFVLQQTLYQSGNYTRRRLHQTRVSWVRNAIAAHAAEAPLSRAIEFGPGSGIYLPMLSERFEGVVAADVESAYLDGIRPLCTVVSNLTLTTDDMMDSRLPENAFGFLLCSEVLEHLPDPERGIRTLYRVLAPGGIAVVSTPQRFAVLEMCCKVAFLPGVIDVIRLIYKEPILETGHISLRRSSTFRRALAGAGFEVVEEDKFALYLPLLAEFGGTRGGRLIEGIERAIKHTPLDFLLWTQAYVLRKPAA